MEIFEECRKLSIDLNDESLDEVVYDDGDWRYHIHPMIRVYWKGLPLMSRACAALQAYKVSSGD